MVFSRLQALTIKIDWHSNVIDIHVPRNPSNWDAPNRLKIYQWDLILNIMLGFQLTDLHEYEFQGGDLSVAVGSIDYLPQFANIDLQDLVQNHLDSIKFLTPTLQQFLNIYPKIFFLKKHLSLKKENNK